MTRRLQPALAALVMLAAARPALAADTIEPTEATERDGAEKTPEPAPPPPNVEGGDPCIDEDVKADLFAKRRQRTSRDRLFQQTNRHELSVRSGYYSSDTFDGVGYLVHHPLGVPIPTFGVFALSYAYHMTEDLAVEATAGLTRLTSNGGPELERTFAVLEGKPRRQLMFDANLVWSIAHAKLRLGGSITHFDFYVTGGGGVVDSALSSGIAGNGGFGLKFFLGRAFGLRLDVRDHVFQQQLLSQSMVVNDITATVGFSIYLPMRE